MTSEKKEMLENRKKLFEEKRKLILSFIHKSCYPIFFVILILLDYDIFCNLFKFDVGLFKEIIYNLDLASINIVIMFILLMFFLASLFFLTSFFAVYVYNLLEDKIIKNLNIYFPIIISIVLLWGIKYIINFLDTKEEFTLYLICIFIIMIFSLLILIFSKLFLRTRTLNKFISISLFIFFYMTFLSNIDDNSYKSVLIILSLFSAISFLFTFIVDLSLNDVVAKIKNNTEKLSKNDLNNEDQEIKKNILLQATIIFTYIFFIIFIYIELKNINHTSWNIGISNEKSLKKDLTFNIFFNKFLIMPNNSDIKIELTKDYHTEIIKELSKEKLLIEEYDEECNNKYYTLINKDYYYLQLTSNIKIFFKNLYTDKNKIYAYRIFLIEEKKFGNSKGSEFTLLSVKNSE